MQPLILVLHILACISIVALVLLQQGKGAEIGAAFGGGASNTLFGSPGASSFLFKLTGVLAIIFFATSLGLSYLASSAKPSTGDDLLLPQAPVTTQVPATPSNT